MNTSSQIFYRCISLLFHLGDYPVTSVSASDSAPSADTMMSPSSATMPIVAVAALLLLCPCLGALFALRTLWLQYAGDQHLTVSQWMLHYLWGMKRPLWFGWLTKARDAHTPPPPSFRSVCGDPFIGVSRELADCWLKRHELVMKWFEGDEHNNSLVAPASKVGPPCGKYEEAPHKKTKGKVEVVRVWLENRQAVFISDGAMMDEVLRARSLFSEKPLGGPFKPYSWLRHLGAHTDGMWTAHRRLLRTAFSEEQMGSNLNPTNYLIAAHVKKFIETIKSRQVEQEGRDLGPAPMMMNTPNSSISSSSADSADEVGGESEASTSTLPDGAEDDATTTTPNLLRDLRAYSMNLMLEAFAQKEDEAKVIFSKERHRPHRARRCMVLARATTRAVLDEAKWLGLQAWDSVTRLRSVAWGRTVGGNGATSISTAVGDAPREPSSPSRPLASLWEMTRRDNWWELFDAFDPQIMHSLAETLAANKDEAKASTFPSPLPPSHPSSSTGSSNASSGPAPLGTNFAPGRMGWTTDRYVDELLYFIGVGKETTAITLTFTLHLLATHPRAQSLVREEARRARLFSDEADDHKGSGNGGTTTPIPRRYDPSLLVYTWAAYREALRLYPTVPFCARIVAKDTVLRRKYDGNSQARGKPSSEFCVLRKGDVVLPSVMVACRDPSRFPDPLSFRPERWVTREGDNEDEPHYKTHPPNSPPPPPSSASHASSPFKSAVWAQRKDINDPYECGARNFGGGFLPCVGKRFAHEVLIQTLAATIDAFEVSVPSTPREVSNAPFDNRFLHQERRMRGPSPAIAENYLPINASA